MDFLENTKKLYQDSKISLDEVEFTIEKKFDPEECNFSNEQLKELKEDKKQFIKKWAYEWSLTFEDILQDVLFVIHHLKSDLQFHRTNLPRYCDSQCRENGHCHRLRPWRFRVEGNFEKSFARTRNRRGRFGCLFS